MASSVSLQVAETIQTAHINRQPSPAHDINPSTAASRKEPVKVEKHTAYPDDGIDEDSGSELDDDGFSFSILRPKSRRTQFPPMPDLRYEQSYLHSIRAADTWWKVVLITVKDQVMMPFMQGIVYNLAICGWQYWNRSAQLSGSTLGARIRRWWWGVNNWPIHTEKNARYR